MTLYPECHSRHLYVTPPSRSATILGGRSTMGGVIVGKPVAAFAFGVLGLSVSLFLMPPIVLPLASDASTSTQVAAASITSVVRNVLIWGMAAVACSAPAVIGAGAAFNTMRS